jgi:hypothetical protein
MPETELIKFAVQLGMGGIFFYLYWITREDLKKQNERHDQDIKQLYEMRIQELKLLAGAKTDLTGEYSMPVKTAQNGV